MELHERIRYIRKESKLSQEKFGQRLGVSRSVINNLERNVLAKPEQKLSLIKLICKEFSINENWMLNEIEPIYTKEQLFSLDDYILEKGASELELQILKAYFDLDPSIRKLTLEHFKSKLSSAIIYENTNQHQDSSDAQLDPDEVVYKKSRSNFAQKTDSFVLNSIEDTGVTIKEKREGTSNR